MITQIDFAFTRVILSI